MIVHKLNTRFYLCLSFLLLIVALIIRVIYMTWLGQISDHGEKMSILMRTISITLFFIVSSSYIYSSIIMLKQHLFHQRTSFSLSENGIENTMTFIMVLSFVFVVPVKRIPWESIKYIDYSDGIYYIRVKTRMVKASFFAKVIIFIRGYSFCYKFTSPYISPEEIYKYNQYINCEKKNM